MSDIILEIKDLSIEIPGERGLQNILSNVNLKLRAGHTLGLVGESGSGKTLTALSIMGLVRLKIPSAQIQGQILYRGLDLLNMEDKALQKIRGRKIAMVLQNPFTFFNPAFKIQKQFLEILGSQNLSRVLEIFRSVSLRDEERILSSYPHELSGGQLQRAMLALALLGQPEILVADEPTTALDPTLKWGVLHRLKKLKEEYGLSLLIISHDLEAVTPFCDEMAMMHRGSLHPYIPEPVDVRSGHE